jgi:hypothetical protein
MVFWRMKMNIEDLCYLNKDTTNLEEVAETINKMIYLIIDLNSTVKDIESELFKLKYDL